MGWRWTWVLGVAVLAVGCGGTEMGDPSTGAADQTTAGVSLGQGDASAANPGPDWRRCSSTHPIEIKGHAKSVCAVDPAPVNTNVTVNGDVAPSVLPVDDTGYQYRFTVTNTSCTDERDLVILLSGTMTTAPVSSLTPDSIPSIGVDVLCPVHHNKCVEKTVHSYQELKACSFKLGAGDDFGCNASLEEPAVQATVVGRLDHDGPVYDTTTVAVENDCGDPTPPYYRVKCGGGDPTYQFYVKNKNEDTLRNMQILAIPAPAGKWWKLCPQGNGRCDKVLIPEGDYHSHPECNFKLGSHDDFGCTAQFGSDWIDTEVYATNNKQLPLFVEQPASCGGPPPPMTGMTPQ